MLQKLAKDCKKKLVAKILSNNILMQKEYAKDGQGIML